jgi:hypothetical protein
MLALVWAAFLALWMFAGLLALMLTRGRGCGGDGGEPFAAPASPAGRYCDALHSYFTSGEPGELTTAIVVLAPVVVLVAVGGVAVWLRSSRLLFVSAVAVTLALVVHVALASSLPDRCSPDHETRPGCAALPIATAERHT